MAFSFILLGGMASADSFNMDFNGGADHHSFSGFGLNDYETDFEISNSPTGMVMDIKKAENTGSNGGFQAVWRKGGSSRYVERAIGATGDDVSLGHHKNQDYWGSSGIMMSSEAMEAGGDYSIHSSFKYYKNEYNYNHKNPADTSTVEVYGSGSATVDDERWCTSSTPFGVDHRSSVDAEGQGSYFRSASGDNHLETEFGTAENGGSFAGSGSFNDGFDSDIETDAW